MSEQIEPGDGWRLIDKHTDKPREGDQYLYWNKWRDRPKPLDPWDFTHTYRRRIPAKPEALEFDDGFGVEVGCCDQLFQILQPGPPDEAGDVVIGNAVEARQLADWLIRFADWREAQGDSK